ncbi:Polyprenol reductase [Gryllus bimaculatus]|nr:Polyprenol reductase [Gryllus bimaculatus]
MYPNLLKLGFILMTFFMVVMGGLINTVEQHLPLFIVQTFRYGKCAYQGKSSFFIKPIEVPKRWFGHFYIFAAIFTTLAAIVVCNVYIFGAKLEPWLLICLDLLASGRNASVSAVSTITALLLLTVQAWHRFHETLFVSVFSDVKMNIVHYLVGYIHYFGSVAAILAESHGFIYLEETVPQIALKDVSFLNVSGCILFLWACYQQSKMGFILANLRKNNKGEVISVKHKIPHGDMFEYVSSPHLLCEILMYLGLTFVMWGASIWPWVFFWVLTNQVESALLTHQWYKTTFSNYPSQRKAIFPFIV